MYDCVINNPKTFMVLNNNLLLSLKVPQVECIHLDIFVWDLSRCCMELKLSYLRTQLGQTSKMAFLHDWYLILAIGYWMGTQLEWSTKGSSHGLSLRLGLLPLWCLGYEKVCPNTEHSKITRKMLLQGFLWHRLWSHIVSLLLHFTSYTWPVQFQCGRRLL